jgi:hypothetical protein
VDADQDVFDGLRHECVRLGSIARHGLQPRRLYGGAGVGVGNSGSQGWNDDPVSDGRLADRPKLGEG